MLILLPYLLSMLSCHHCYCIVRQELEGSSGTIGHVMRSRLRTRLDVIQRQVVNIKNKEAAILLDHQAKIVVEVKI